MEPKTIEVVSEETQVREILKTLPLRVGYQMNIYRLEFKNNANMEKKYSIRYIKMSSKDIGNLNNEDCLNDFIDKSVGVSTISEIEREYSFSASEAEYIRNQIWCTLNKLKAYEVEKVEKYVSGK